MLGTYRVNPIWRDPFKYPGPNHNVVVHWKMLLHREKVGQYQLSGRKLLTLQAKNLPQISLQNNSDITLQAYHQYPEAQQGLYR